MVTGIKLSEIVSISSAAKQYAVSKGVEDIKRIVLNDGDTDEEKLKLIKGMADAVALRYEEFILHCINDIASIMNEAKEKEKEVINNKLIDLIKNKE